MNEKTGGADNWVEKLTRQKYLRGGFVGERL